jgi:Sulfatase-modifying factor enzyme 1
LPLVRRGPYDPYESWMTQIGRAVRATMAAFGLAACAGVSTGPPPPASPPVSAAGPITPFQPTPLLEETPPAEEPTPESTPSPTWQLVSGRHWQLVGPPGEDPAVTDARENGGHACPVGMVEIRGRMKQHRDLDFLQMLACKQALPKPEPKSPTRCAEYDRERWRALSKNLRTKAMAYCIDRFEYPNRMGQNPIVMVTWAEAASACRATGKRLCSEDEWTFACEGEEATPYPNGYVRDDEACVLDRPTTAFDESAMRQRTSDRARAEIERLWQGAPSGSHPRCKSAFGVHDLIGNVDEWARSTVKDERPSILKGGFWGRVRTRCRSSTRAHGEAYSMFQQGFRCCADRQAPTTK